MRNVKMTANEITLIFGLMIKFLTVLWYHVESLRTIIYFMYYVLSFVESVLIGK